jgi:DNA-binding response OmpR family regulator
MSGEGAGLGHCLLAEDDPDIARLVSFKLKREGFDVTIAEDGAQAIARLSEHDWSLVILDVMMPGHDGWQVLRELRSRTELARTPVLMLTAKGFDRDMGRAVELGAQEYLRKPFDPGELGRIARKLAQSGRGEGR